MYPTNSSHTLDTQAGSSRSIKKNGRSARGPADPRAKKLLIKWDATFATRSPPRRNFSDVRTQAAAQRSHHQSNQNVDPAPSQVQVTKAISDVGGSATQYQPLTSRRSTRAGPCRRVQAASAGPRGEKNREEKNRQVEEPYKRKVTTSKSTPAPANRPIRVPESRGSIERRPENPSHSQHGRRSTRAGRPKNIKPYARPREDPRIRTLEASLSTFSLTTP
ncbi:hypothetical protein PCANC_00983 [Puccinia coronata f. sp. avenae]|uniref:Uncharacterized protein n=1 Tax=Puccinia coronata f. sp. avenae TaxID=200324 RepID=A0A2N5VIC8_9BASI|nr:hypothetical protein PCANC_04005 [Puccinia coronata f. sp. avenae]PLW49750.1 hypothetical protein PCASD_01584 [Puccinia coronata f. sp. avenae]PLW57857.1 hypothetical protein PCANC_00983 [Puccinia coronata f. sp. avenae]